MKNYLEQSILLDTHRADHYEKLAGKPSRFKIICRFNKRTKKNMFYLREVGSEKEVYVRDGNLDKVVKLQEKEFARTIAKNIRHNIKVKKNCLEKLLPDDELEVIASMPLRYRPNRDKVSNWKIHQSECPYHTEELKLCTSFGLYVRSRGEMAIAQLLYGLGIEFYYEKALTIESSQHSQLVTYYPDFTIILPNGDEIYWEHQGMLSSQNYVKHNLKKVMDYNYNGIFQPRNLIITADGPNNIFDLESIKRLVIGTIMPLLNESREKALQTYQ